MGRDAIQLRVIKTITEFEQLHTAWDALIEHAPAQDLFLTWEWFEAWFKSYGKGANIRLYTAWANEELIGLAPLMLITQKKYGLKFRVLRTLSAPQCDVGGFLIKHGDREILTALLNQIVSQKGEWDLLELNQLSLSLSETSAIGEFLSAQGYAIQQNTTRHYYIPYQNDWDAYHASLSKNFRKNMRRSERGVEALGTPRIQRFTGPQVTWEVIETIIAINRHATYPLLCDSQEDQDLHRTFIQSMAEKRWVDVYILTINDVPVAYEYGFLYKGRMGDWRVGFDRRTDPSVSVGVYLTMKVMQTGFAEKQIEIDYLRGDEGYKNDWRPEFREYIHLKATRPLNFITAMAFIWAPAFKAALQSREKSPAIADE